MRLAVLAFSALLLCFVGNSDLSGQEPRDSFPGVRLGLIYETSYQPVLAVKPFSSRFGGEGIDRIDGGDGDDQILGGSGADELFGNQGQPVQRLELNDKEPREAFVFDLAGPLADRGRAEAFQLHNARR